MPTVFLDGRFVPASDACVSAFDAGFQHGVGLFETMLAVRDGARVVHLHEHLERLRRSARTLGLSDSLRVGALAEAVRRTVDRAFQDDERSARLRVRLTITGGDLNLLSRGETRAEHLPTLLLAAQPATDYPAEMFESGVLATLADLRVNPLDDTQGHKTLNYWGRLRELQAAAAKRAGESLVFSITNHLAGGCVSNAFVVHAGELWTPIARGEEEDVASQGDESAVAPADPDVGPPDEPAHAGAGPGAQRGAVIPSPVLPGVVRRWVMDWALAEGRTVRRRMISLDDVLRADELLLTNSSWGVLPVTRFESRPIGTGEVGELGTRLAAAWRDLIAAGG
ncbi:MAG: aminotransferase class IV [Planctomycetota bacterium]|nr:aminotransferase class IV [Planctomycetota bacterium]